MSQFEIRLGKELIFQGHEKRWDDESDSGKLKIYGSFKRLPSTLFLFTKKHHLNS